VSEAPVGVGREGVFELRERLSDRDLELLEYVGELRLLGARQVQTLLFSDDRHATAATAARCCRRVLERLTRERLIARLERRVGGARAGSASHIYALTSLGQRVLDQGGPRRRLAEPSARFVDHTLAVADLLVQLVASERAGRCESLSWQAELECWREVETLGGRVILRPDLFVALATEEYDLRWFVEVDRGSEHLPALLRKCRIYHSYYKSGLEQRRHDVFPRVLWITTSDRRAAALRQAIGGDRRLTADIFRVTTTTDALKTIGDRS